jgi:hypothetical protein
MFSLELKKNGSHQSTENILSILKEKIEAYTFV